MRFVIEQEVETLDEIYHLLSGLGQRLYDELDENEKKKFNEYLKTLREITPEIIDDLLVNYRHKIGI